MYDISFARTWWRLIATFGLLPLVAAIAWRSWPRELRMSAVVVIPIWTAIHFLFADAAETRLFLVPLAVIVIPGAVFADVTSLPSLPKNT